MRACRDQRRKSRYAPNAGRNGRWNGLLKSPKSLAESLKRKPLASARGFLFLLSEQNFENRFDRICIHHRVGNTAENYFRHLYNLPCSSRAAVGSGNDLRCVYEEKLITALLS